MGKGFTNQELAAQAEQRIRDGKRPNSVQRRALEAVQAEKIERIALHWMAAVPKSEFSRLANRKIQQINEQAARYNMPTGGLKVDIPAVLRWIYDFLAANSHRLGPPRDGNDPLLAGPNSPNLERYRKAKAISAERENLRQERQILPREDVERALEIIAGRLRWFGEWLKTQCGDEAFRQFSAVLADADQKIAVLFEVEHDQNQETARRDTKKDSREAGSRPGSRRKKR